MRGLQILLSVIFIALILTAGALYIGHVQTRRISNEVALLSRSVKIANHGDRFQRNFRKMALGLRRYLSTNELTFRTVYEQALVDNNLALHELTMLVPENSEQRILVDDIRELQQYWIDEVASPMLEARESLQREKGKRYFQKLYKQKHVEKIEIDVGSSLQRKFLELMRFSYGASVATADRTIPLSNISAQ